MSRREVVKRRWRMYDYARGAMRGWEHTPDCGFCRGTGAYDGYGCPCGGWADEIDQWAGPEQAAAIRARWAREDAEVAELAELPPDGVWMAAWRRGLSAHRLRHAGLLTVCGRATGGRGVIMAWAQAERDLAARRCPRCEPRAPQEVAGA